MFSSSLMTRTSEGGKRGFSYSCIELRISIACVFIFFFTPVRLVPSAPRNLSVLVTDITFLNLSWELPALLYASKLGPYYITYGVDGSTEMVHIPKYSKTKSQLKRTCTLLLFHSSCMHIVPSPFTYMYVQQLTLGACTRVIVVSLSVCLSVCLFVASLVPVYDAHATN